MAARSLLLVDPLGILCWPVLFGFGLDRIAEGKGIVGGTLGGLFSFGVAALGVSTSLELVLLMLAAGVCWGCYLSICAYILVETLFELD